VDRQIAAEQPRAAGVDLCAQQGAREGFSLMMTQLRISALHPGLLDDRWRNGSFAILLGLGILLVGHALALRNKTLAAEALSPAKEISRLPSSAAASLGDHRGLRGELYASGDDEDGDVYGR
jgi:hypothetical protein